MARDWTDEGTTLQKLAMLALEIATGTFIIASKIRSVLNEREGVMCK
jgi:hypothetical protein